MRPAVYLSPAVYAQAIKDAEHTARLRGCDIDALHAKQAKAERRDKADDADPAGDELDASAHVVEDMGDDGAPRLFDVTIGEVAYVVSATDRPAAAREARRQHAATGLRAGAVRVRNHGGTS